MMPIWTFLTLNVVFAKELSPELAAEHKRIQEEMLSLAQQESWSGVERNYQKLLDFEKSGAEISADNHMLGASAAASRGELDVLILRLEAAIAVGSAEKAQIWLDTLKQQTAVIEMRLEVSGAVTLKPTAFIVDQSYTEALRRAEGILLRTGEFSGRLPLGEFTVVGDTVEQPFTVMFGGNEKVIVKTESPRQEGEPLRFGALFLGSYNQYLKNAVIEAAPRSHSNFGGMLGYSYAQVNDKLGFGTSLGFAGAGGVDSGQVLALSSLWFGPRLPKGVLGLGPQLGTGWSRVVGITKEHAATLCDPALCSDFERLLTETVSQTRYLNVGGQLSYQHLPEDGISWMVYTASRFEQNMMVINVGINLSLRRVP